jgi:DNA-binding transcriptional LysR family regulator
VWLPLDDDHLDHVVLVSERRWVALSRDHQLAGLTEVDFRDLLDEPFIALPASAGRLRDFWLATDARDGRPVHVAAEAASAEEKFELIASGVGVGLLSEGNVALYARPDIVFRPVHGLSPSQLAVAWRGNDARPAVRAFVEACGDAARRGAVS